MIFLLACLFLARRYGTSAAPGASFSAYSLAYDAPIFTRDECSNDCSCPGRSVWDIVWSCLATTFAVTWVSVHPNVPFLGESSLSLLKRRIFLMCLALLAPEVMIIWAFKQWRGALMIRETINEARPKSCAQPEWTMAHAHFLQMGGFTVKYRGMEWQHATDGSLYCTVPPEEFSYYDYGETWMGDIEVRASVLHFNKLRQLLREQRIDFPDTTAKEIEDRSKGDALSKGVALLQITWFIMQLIARAHQHLAITEIELTTAALAGLNSLLYIFWWSKPLDIRCPIVIRTKEVERLLARKTEGNGENVSRNDGSKIAERWTFSKDKFRLRDYLRNSAQSIIPARVTRLRSLVKWLLKTIRASHRLLPQRTRTMGRPEIGPENSLVMRSHFRWLRTSCTLSHFRRGLKWIRTTCTFVITKLFYLPYLFMFTPMDMIFGSHDVRDYSDPRNQANHIPALRLLFDEGDMEWIMSMIFYSEKAEIRPLVIFSALAGAAFGSIHCAAWHFDFPSPVERILWRTTSLTIVGVCFCIIAVAPLYIYVYNKWGHSSHYRDRFFWHSIKRSLETIPAIVYPIARLSLLILALLSLRRLPPSAFETVTWTKFIPHI